MIINSEQRPNCPAKYYFGKALTACLYHTTTKHPSYNDLRTQEAIAMWVPQCLTFIVSS